MKKAMNDFNEVEYFANVARLKYAIGEMMKKHHLIKEIKPNTSTVMVNPYYGRIENNGAYAVEFSRGVPQMIYSPYGSVSIESAYHCRGTLVDYKNFIREIGATFGLIEMEPIVKNKVDLCGPRCMVTRLPWNEKQKLPTAFVDTKGKKPAKWGNAEEEEYIETILKQVDAGFIKEGHPELTFANIGVKSMPIIEKTVEPKKRKCIINWEKVKHVLKILTTEKEL